MTAVNGLKHSLIELSPNNRHQRCVVFRVPEKMNDNPFKVELVFSFSLFFRRKKEYAIIIFKINSYCKINKYNKYYIFKLLYAL